MNKKTSGFLSQPLKPANAICVYQQERFPTGKVAYRLKAEAGAKFPDYFCADCMEKNQRVARMILESSIVGDGLFCTTCHQHFMIRINPPSLYQLPVSGSNPIQSETNKAVLAE